MVWFQDKLLKLISFKTIDEVLSQYDNLKVHSLTPLSGWQNLVLKLTTNSGILILRIHRRRNLKRLEFALDVIEYLLNSGFPVPKFLKMKNGERIISVQIGKRSYLAVLFEYLEGETKVVLSQPEIAQLGKLVGKLHSSLANFKVGLIFPKLNLTNLAKTVKKEIWQKFEKQPKIFNLWQEFYPVLQEKFTTNFQTLSKNQLIHGDLAPSNIVFTNSEIRRILDFDGLILAPKIWDLANFIGNYVQTVKSWGAEDKIFAIFKSLIGGYEQTYKLSLAEKQLIPILIRLWFFRKILWAARESTKKYRTRWANEVISWCCQALEEKF